MSDECFCAVEPWPGGAWPPLCDHCERKSKAIATMREVTDPMTTELSQLRAQLDDAKRVIEAARYFREGVLATWSRRVVRDLDERNEALNVALRDYDAKHGAK
jgi:hypothetical protein